MHAPASSPPARIAQLAQLWDQVIAASEDYNAKIDRIAQGELVDLPASREKYEAVLHNEGRVDVSSVCNRIRSRIVDFAIERFSPRGTRLELDAERMGKSKLGELHPLALWMLLERELGGGRCHEAAFRALAKRIVSAFYMREGEAVRTVAGRAVLSMGLFWDDRYGGSGWGYSSRESAEKALRDLLPVLLWGGIDDPNFAEDARKAGSLLSEQKDVPRGLRWPVGGVLELVPFKGKLEFRFTPAAAEVLGLFISTYGELYPAR